MELEERLINDEQLDSVAGGSGIEGMEKLGYLTIKVDTEIKLKPDLNAETVRVVSWCGLGVFEIDTNQGLLWYRTGLNRWVAENPKNTFTTFKGKF
ncbi:MAG: hypothetical protein IKO38_00770 [Erysipelotrichaceae bacterium]|nr:hypothetical protein [Erysipelotrichaceae bacterium]